MFFHIIMFLGGMFWVYQISRFLWLRFALGYTTKEAYDAVNEGL